MVRWRRPCCHSSPPGCDRIGVPGRPTRDPCFRGELHEAAPRPILVTTGPWEPSSHWTTRPNRSPDRSLPLIQPFARSILVRSMPPRNLVAQALRRRPMCAWRSRVLTGLAATWVALACSPEQGQPRPKVLLIGIDGVRPDILAEVDTPNLDALIEGGAYSDRARTTRPTVSGPGWSSMLTGVWPDKHGVTSNDFSGSRYERFPDFLTRIESLRPELRTFAVADWMPLVGDDSGGPLIGAAPDVKHVLNGYEVGWREADSLSTEIAVQELGSADPDALFVYLGNPDETSHHHGSIGVEYREAIREADRRVGQLVEAIRAREGDGTEDWLILVSTDHGRRMDGGHGGDSEEEFRIFFLASGPSAVQGRLEGTPRIVDVAVTALAHLGFQPEPAWELDGSAVGLRR